MITSCIYVNLGGFFGGRPRRCGGVVLGGVVSEAESTGAAMLVHGLRVSGCWCVADGERSSPGHRDVDVGPVSCGWR